MIRVVICEAKRDCDPDDEPRWTGIVVVTRVEGTKIWFKPSPMSELSKCDEAHTETREWVIH